MTVQERQQVQEAYMAAKVTHERAYVERRAAERAVSYALWAPEKPLGIAAARRALRVAEDAEEAALQAYMPAHKAGDGRPDRRGAVSDLLTTAEAAALLGIDRSRVLRLIGGRRPPQPGASATPG